MKKRFFCFSIIFLSYFILTSLNVSAFCNVQGYTWNFTGDRTGADPVYMVCVDSEDGNTTHIQTGQSQDGYGHIFGGIFDGCSEVCDQGVYVNASNSTFGIFGEYFNLSCGDIATPCWTNINMSQKIPVDAIVYTYLNNSRSNISISNGTSIYLNSTLQTGSGDIKLYNNGTLINEGSSPLSNYTTFVSYGIYNITTLYEGNENYTPAIETWFVNVVPASNLSFPFEGLLSYWKLDDTFLDELGANNASSEGSIDFVEGIFNNGSRTDNSGEGVNVTDTSDLEIAEGSISLWINPNTWGTSYTQRIIAKGKGASDDLTAFTLQSNDGSTKSIHFQLQKPDDSGYWRFEPISNTVSNIPTGIWSHITITWGSDGLKFYLNGTSFGTDTSGYNSDGFINSSRNWQISGWGGNNRNFDGTIDEVAFWNRSLSSQEILNLYNSGEGFFYP